jgi:hypothetical protein
VLPRAFDEDKFFFHCSKDVNKIAKRAPLLKRKSFDSERRTPFDKSH